MQNALVKEARTKNNSGCTICGSSNLSFLISQSASKHLGIDTEFTILQCNDCSAAFVSNPPSPEDLPAFYNETFFSTSQQDVPLTSEGTFQASAEFYPIFVNAKARCQDLLTRSPAHSKLLDVGCGKGFFIKVCSEHYDVEGAELSESAAAFANERLRLNVHCGDFTALDLPEQHFDVITLWDVLASFPDPVSCIGKVSRLLKPGGLLVLTIPDITSLCFKVTRNYWPLLIPPINLFYFSESSIKRLLSAQGIAVEEYRHHGKYLSSNFVLRKLGRIAGISALDREGISLPGLKNIYLNLGDIATVYARKK